MGRTPGYSRFFIAFLLVFDGWNRWNLWTSLHMNEWFSFDTPVMFMFVHSCIPCILPCKYHANILNSIRFAVLTSSIYLSQQLPWRSAENCSLHIHVLRAGAPSDRFSHWSTDAGCEALRPHAGGGVGPESFSIPHFLVGDFFAAKKSIPLFLEHTKK